MRRSSLVKTAVLLVVLAGVAALFLRTVRQAGAEPYRIREDRLINWAVVGAPRDAQRTVVALQPSVELSADLFRQIFKRTMTSLSTPAVPLVPLALANEFEGGEVNAALMEQVMAVARDAGLETARPRPRCVAIRRLTEPGGSLDFYYLVLEFPEFGRFRDGIARLVETTESTGDGRGSFEATALTPVLIVAASERGLAGPLPFRPDPDRDCVAPGLVE